MESLEELFLSHVSAFLRWSGVSPTALGRKAVGDPGLMRDIARGRSPTLRTADRVLAYIAGFRLDSGGARAPPRSRRRREPARRAGSSEAAARAPMEGKKRVPTRLLRLPEVQRRTGLSRTTIYVWRRARRFPQPVLIGPRTLAWFESELEEWMRERSAQSPGRREGRRPPTPKRKEERR